jgi:hypothetical protein
MRKMTKDEIYKKMRTERRNNTWVNEYDENGKISLVKFCVPVEANTLCDAGYMANWDCYHETAGKVLYNQAKDEVKKMKAFFGDDLFVKRLICLNTITSDYPYDSHRIEEGNMLVFVDEAKLLKIKYNPKDVKFYGYKCSMLKKWSGRNDFHFTDEEMTQKNLDKYFNYIEVDARELFSMQKNLIIYGRKYPVKPRYGDGFTEWIFSRGNSVDNVTWADRKMSTLDMARVKC